MGILSGILNQSEAGTPVACVLHYTNDLSFVLLVNSIQVRCGIFQSADLRSRCLVSLPTLRESTALLERRTTRMHVADAVYHVIDHAYLFS